MIEYVSFGKLVFKGKVYRSDCIIEGKSINSRWWRKEGDKLSYEDIADLVNDKPDVIVIGKGFLNFLDIPESTISGLKEKGIEVIIKKTDDAVEMYNRLIGKKKVVGVFHLV